VSLVNTPHYLSTGESDSLCWYCGVPLVEPVGGRPHASNTRTQDHVFPLALGGTGMAHNKVPCCFRCNQWKGMRELEEFRAIARPGAGTMTLFYAETSELELAGQLKQLADKKGGGKPFNSVLAEKLKLALNLEEV